MDDYERLAAERIDRAQGSIFIDFSNRMPNSVPLIRGSLLSMRIRVKCTRQKFAVRGPVERHALVLHRPVFRIRDTPEVMCRDALPGKGDQLPAPILAVTTGAKKGLREFLVLSDGVVDERKPESIVLISDDRGVMVSEAAVVIGGIGAICPEHLIALNSCHQRYSPIGILEFGFGREARISNGLIFSAR